MDSIPREPPTIQTQQGGAKQTKMKGEMDFKLKNRRLLDVGLPARIEVKLNLIFGYITNDFLV